MGSDTSDNCFLITKYFLSQINSGSESVVDLYPAVFEYLNTVAFYISDNTKKMFEDNEMMIISNTWKCINPKTMIFPKNDNPNIDIIAKYLPSIQIVSQSSLYSADKVHPFITQVLKCPQNLPAHQCLQVLNTWHRQGVPEPSSENLKLIYSFLSNCPDWKDAVRKKFDEFPLIYCNGWKNASQLIWLKEPDFFADIYKTVLVDCDLSQHYSSLQTFFCTKLKITIKLSIKHHISVLEEIAKRFNRQEIQVTAMEIKKYIDFVYEQVSASSKREVSVFLSLFAVFDRLDFFLCHAKSQVLFLQRRSIFRVKNDQV